MSTPGASQTPSASQTFTAGCMLSAATAFRVGIGCLEVWSKSGPKLIKVGFESWEGKTNVARAQTEFRDELISMARQSSEVALQELRKGVDDLDAFTRPKEAQTARSTRPYKAKR